MNQRIRAALLFFVLAIVAAAFRFPRLADRPMHCDEGVNADRLGTLLEQGRYEYSAVDFHGPTLYYASLLVTRAQGITRYVDLNETLLRSVPALFGVLLVAAHYLLIPYLGLSTAAFAALFTAVSPAMVYYSRYFIHETVLIFLTFCAILSLFAYFHRRTAARAALIGLLLGLMYATKETFILPVACMFLAAMASGYLPGRGAALQPAGTTVPSRWRDVPIVAASFLITAALFLSSFLTHPRGVIDSVMAYRTYFERGAGLNTAHIHPWHFYFARLLYFNAFTEAFLAALAVLGLVIAFRTPGIPRFFAIYTVLMVAIYSAIPYKAPWNILGGLQGLILLAGIASTWLLQRTPKIALGLVFLGVAHLGWQAQAASFAYAADPRNPWVYAHTGLDVNAIRSKVEALAAAHPAGKGLPIQIVTTENLWPLPWYFRRYPGVRWWNAVSDSAPTAPVILATPDMEAALIHKIYELPPPGQREMYVNMFDRYVELRPRVEIRGYVAKSLWDEVREMP